MGYFLFGSLLSASSVSKLIFLIKANKDNTKISTPIFSGSGKNVVFFGSMAASASPKSSSSGIATYSRTSVSGGFKFGSTKGGSELRHCSKSRQIMLVVS